MRITDETEILFNGERTAYECAVCGAETVAVRCGICRKATYCSIDCQRRDWRNGHNTECYLHLNLSVRDGTANFMEAYGCGQGEELGRLGGPFTSISREREATFRAHVIGNVTLCPGFSDEIIEGVFVQKQASETEYLHCTYGDFRSPVE